MITLSMLRPRRCAVSLALLLTLILVGCGGGNSNDQASANREAVAGDATLTPDQEAAIQKIAAVANAIEADPGTMDQALKDANLTAEEFQSEIYRISADPALTRAFEAARKK